MDVASGDVREAGGFDGAKNISPQWTRRRPRRCTSCPTARGITNIYRSALDGGATTQLTNLLTGVSGITALSPALSAGGGPRRLQRLRGGRLQHLRARNARSSSPARALVDLPLERGGAAAAPHAAKGRCSRRSNDPIAGLPPASAQRRPQPYKPKLVARLRGPADDRRRHRSVRHLRVGRGLVPLQRHARQSRRRDRRRR